MSGLTFKPYATGTMNQPYIDCALAAREARIRRGGRSEIVCETAEGYVKRLWEPIAAKRHPPNGYAAKFSTPFNVAVAFVPAARDSKHSARRPCAIRGSCNSRKVHYAVDPQNPYPRAYTGHVKMKLNDGRVFEERQPHIRGGVHEPLSRADIERKFRGNAAYGGWTDSLASRFLAFADRAFDATPALAPFRASLFVCALLPALVAAQGYPAKPVRIVVPAQPGGGLDLIGRTIGDQLSRSMAQSFFIENISAGRHDRVADGRARAHPTAIR
jgi:hypothetical protein